MNNSSNVVNCSQQEQALLYTPAAQTVFSLLYAVIFIVGVAGNVLVSVAVVRMRHRGNISGATAGGGGGCGGNSVTNVFILNLAVSDVVMCLLAVPLTPLQSFTGQWFFVYISTLTLTLIAVDRFVVIMHPFRARMQLKTSFALVTIIDITACAFTAPYAVHMEYEERDGITRCYESWYGLKRTLYGFFTNITQFVLPFVTIILCYSAIIRRLRARASNRPGAPASTARELAERARTTRTNRMLISMVVAFGFCWLPLNSINLVADLGVYDLSCWRYFYFAFFLCHVVAMSSTCYNPFLYAWHNESFRREFLRMLPCLAAIFARTRGGNDENGSNHCEFATAAITSRGPGLTTVNGNSLPIPSSSLVLNAPLSDPVPLHPGNRSTEKDVKETKFDQVVLEGEEGVV